MTTGVAAVPVAVRVSAPMSQPLGVAGACKCSLAGTSLYLRLLFRVLSRSLARVKRASYSSTSKRGLLHLEYTMTADHVPVRLPSCCRLPRVVPPLSMQWPVGSIGLLRSWTTTRQDSSNILAPESYTSSSVAYSPHQSQDQDQDFSPTPTRCRQSTNDICAE